MVSPEEAYDNLQVLKRRALKANMVFMKPLIIHHPGLSRKQNYVVVKSFMAHHQGMSFLSISYLIAQTAHATTV